MFDDKLQTLSIQSSTSRPATPSAPRIPSSPTIATIPAMRYLLSTLTTLAWALWFGGLATMFVVTRATFRESHDLGRAANPVMFRTFEPYILVVAGLATVSAVAWLALNRSLPLRIIAVLLVLSAIAAGYAHYGVSRPMQSLSP